MRMRQSQQSKNPYWLITISALIFTLATLVASAAPKDELRERLQSFKSNPAQHLQFLPPKKSKSAKANQEIFSAEQVRSNQFVEDKDQTRANFCKITEAGIKVCVKDIDGRAGFESNDDAKNLVDNSHRMVRTLESIEKRGLTQAKLKESPWSDSYWPIYQGVLGSRYAHPDAPSSRKFKDFAEFFKERPLHSFFSTPKDLNFLSPAEKYDLIVGDTGSTLTKAMWSQGEYYARNNSGKVETWMGICHGWAPAAYMLARPQSSVTVPTTVLMNGVQRKLEITFYPSDIKALASYLWANANVNSRFVGGRCNDKSPEKDRKNGRIKDQECFDTNPGTWHLAIVNQIGISKRSFVMDATFDYEVWNQPVHSYSYTYFNPKTLEPVDKLADAKVKIADFTDDKFKDYRDSKARTVVGVSMEVTYVVETHPSDSLTDGPDDDALKSVTYEYDLELDAKGKIVGGEWYSNAHPDFLWTPAPEDRAISELDDSLSGKWQASEPVPAQWQKVAQRASQSGDVLAGIVEALVAAAQKE